MSLFAYIVAAVVLTALAAAWVGIQLDRIRELATRGEVAEVPFEDHAEEACAVTQPRLYLVGQFPKTNQRRNR